MTGKNNKYNIQENFGYDNKYAKKDEVPDFFPFLNLFQFIHTY